MQIQTLVGQPAANADGAAPQVRAGRLGDLIHSQLHGRYYEQTSRGNVFSAALATTSGTIAAGPNTAPPLELVEGDILLPPGTMWVPTWAAAGPTLLNAYGVTWEEVPI